MRLFSKSKKNFYYRSRLLENSINQQSCHAWHYTHLILRWEPNLSTATISKSFKAIFSPPPASVHPYIHMYLIHTAHYRIFRAALCLRRRSPHYNICTIFSLFIIPTRCRSARPLYYWPTLAGNAHVRARSVYNCATNRSRNLRVWCVL